MREALDYISNELINRTFCEIWEKTNFSACCISTHGKNDIQIIFNIPENI